VIALRTPPAAGVWAVMNRMTLSMVVALATGCGTGLERHPGAAQSGASVLGGPSLGPIGTACGALGAGGLRVAALSRDDALVAVGYGSGRVAVHDARAGGAFLRAFQAHPVPVTALLFLSDGTLVTGAADGGIALWSPEGDPLGTLVGATTPIMKLVSGAGESVISALEEAVVRSWRRSDGRALWVSTVEARKLYNLIPVAGRGLLLPFEGTVELRDFATGTPVPLDLSPFNKPNLTVRDVSPDGRRAFVTFFSEGEGDPAHPPQGRTPLPPGAGFAGEVVTFPTGVSLWQRPGPLPRLVQFSGDGTRLAQVVSIQPEELPLMLLDAATGASRGTLGVGSRDVRGLAFGRSGDRVLLDRRLDDEEELVELRSADGGGWMHEGEAGSPSKMRMVAAAPDAGTVVTLSTHGWGILRVWDVASATQRLARKAVTSFALSPDGTRLVASDRGLSEDAVPTAEASHDPAHTADLTLIDLTSGAVSGSFAQTGCYLPAFTPDGEHVWAACLTAGDGHLRRFRISDGAEDARLDGPPIRPAAMAVSADGALLAARDVLAHGPGVVVWDLATGGRLWEAEPNDPLAHDDNLDGGTLAFSPDGAALAIWSRRYPELEPLADSLVRIYATRTGKVITELLPPATATGFGPMGRSLAYSADGALLAVHSRKVVVYRTSDWSPFDPFDGPLPDEDNGIGLAVAGSNVFFGGADFRLHVRCGVRLPTPETP
jgi:WD40 repeat protein